MKTRLTATDLAINARAQVVLWEVCRAVGATGKGGEPNDNALCLWGHRSLAEVSRTDLEAWAGCVGTGLLFSGYYAAMDQLSKMASTTASKTASPQAERKNELSGYSECDDPFGDGPEPEPGLPSVPCSECGKETPVEVRVCIHCGHDESDEDMGSRDIEREEGTFGT